MTIEHSEFPALNPAFENTFKADALSVGLVVPIERYSSSAVPSLEQHSERVQRAEQLGFAAVWLRDVPFNVPSFGDAGQTFDPFPYLGFLAAKTHRIALGVASVILPLRHPAHVAKMAASVDVLSGGRLLLGVASGDRPEEYPAMNRGFEDRADRFRESFDYIRHMAEDFPAFQNPQGSVSGMDMLPKPYGLRLPMLVTGGSRQDPDWVALNSDGWITYPRSVAEQARVVSNFRDRVAAQGHTQKPVTQSLYIDLQPDPDAPPRPIHLGFSSGVNALIEYLKAIELIGINHVALNLRFNQQDIDETLQRLAETLLPEFHAP